MSVRELRAATIELSFTAQGKQHSILQEAHASTGARLHIVDTFAKKGAKANGTTVSDLSGDVLAAQFDSVDGSARLSTMHGTGNTVLHRVDEQGADAISTGRQLDAVFQTQTPKPGTGKQPSATAVELQRAIQSGSVKLTRTTAAKPGTPSVIQHGSANEAVYEAASDSATLIGAAYLADPSGTVWAQRIVMLHDSGDATAEGGVRATYLQPAQSNQTAPPEPVHVLSDHAVFHHDDSIAVFYGKPARLWQTGTQVEAPILEFDQNRRTLFAHSPVASDNSAVHAVLVPSANPAAAPTKPAPAKAEAKPGQQQSPIRVASRELTYNDTTRQIDLRGSVVVDDGDTTMQACQAVVFLKPAAKPGTPPKSAPAIAIPGGQIDHIVATGDIEMRQPGRVATGEQLVYTASDGISVLTGTPDIPPKAVDDVQGTVTGDSLRFKSGENSIVVTGGGGSRRVHTSTQMKQ
jgi:lipopolysaccharide export system protein LptA